MAEHPDDWGGDVGGPHGDNAVGVPQLHDAVPGILPHHIACPHLGPVLRNDLPRACILHYHSKL